MTKNQQIILGDCLKELPNIKEKSIDLILTDLPYGITSNHWDSIIPLDSLWNLFKYILKENGVIALTSSQPFTSKLVVSNESMFKHEWIWEKDAGSNFANTVREPMKEHETVLIFSNGNWTYNPIKEERVGSRKGKVTMSNFESQSTNYREFEVRLNNVIPVLRVPRSIQRFNRERGLHPNQKPVKLFEYLIKTYTNENDLVLDCCAGSGTTAEACLNTNRQFICIEKEQEYYDKMIKRIEPLMKQEKSFC